MSAAISLSHGANFPYDAPDEYDVDNPPVAFDWAHAAARGVIADLQDRGGIKHGFSNIDHEIRIEIVEALSAIIRTAQEGDRL